MFFSFSFQVEKLYAIIIIFRKQSAQISYALFPVFEFHVLSTFCENFQKLLLEADF